jgi:hypothetical protein
MRFLLAAAVAVLAAPAAASEPTPVADLAQQLATVEGTVHRITDEDEFLLADSTGHVRIYVGPARVPVQPGELVTVTGFVDDGLRIEIYAQEIVRADGTTFAFDHRY